MIQNIYIVINNFMFSSWVAGKITRKTFSLQSKPFGVHSISIPPKQSLHYRYWKHLHRKTLKVTFPNPVLLSPLDSSRVTPKTYEQGHCCEAAGRGSSTFLRWWGEGAGNLATVWPVKCFRVTDAINVLTRCWWMGLQAQRTTRVHYINEGAKGSQAAFPKSWRKFGTSSGTETNFLQAQFCALTVGSHQKNWVSSHKQPLGVGSASHNT